MLLLRAEEPDQPPVVPAQPQPEQELREAVPEPLAEAQPAAVEALVVEPAAERLVGQQPVERPPERLAVAPVERQAGQLAAAAARLR